MPDHPGQHLDVIERRVGEVEVGDVGIGQEVRAIDVADEAGQLVHVLDQRLENGSSSSTISMFFVAA